MKNTHNNNVHQNQVVKININNTPKKTHHKRKNDKPLNNFMSHSIGGWSVPPIIHNDNRPDTSEIEDKLRKLYELQTIPHRYTNEPTGDNQNPMVRPYNEDEYLYGPDLPTPMTSRADTPLHTAAQSIASHSPRKSPSPSLQSAHEEPEVEVPSHHTSPFPDSPIRRRGRERKHPDRMTKKAVVNRIKRKIRELELLSSNKKRQAVEDIKTDINHLDDVYGENFKHLLPPEYH